MTARVQLARYESRAGGCEDRNEPFSGTYIDARYEASDVLLIERPKAPDARVLQGTELFDVFPPGLAAIPGTTGQHTIEVSWHLHRIDWPRVCTFAD